MGEGYVTVRFLLRWTAVVFWMSGIFLLSAIPSLALPPSSVYDHPLRKLGHVIEYAVLTLLLSRAFQLHVHHPSQAWLLAGLVAGMYAVSDEWHQTFVPGREGTVRDVMIDSGGIVVASMLVLLTRGKAVL
jgi:VanZ family protein